MFQYLDSWAGSRQLIRNIGLAIGHANVTLERGILASCSSHGLDLSEAMSVKDNGNQHAISSLGLVIAIMLKKKYIRRTQEVFPDSRRHSVVFELCTSLIPPKTCSVYVVAPHS
jgi:hypothetical protein